MASDNRSQRVVDFLANLAPLFGPEWQGESRYARSLSDGSLYAATPQDSGLDQIPVWIRVHWNGDPTRSSEVDGEDVATIALERYVRLHATGYGEETVAAELWHMAKHFNFKTGCSLNLPQLREPPSHFERASRRALEMGQGVLVDLLKKFVGIG